VPPQTPAIEEVLDEAIEARLESVQTAMPGRVVSFNGDNCTASVQPTIKQVHRREDGTEVASTLPVIPNVPVIFPGSGSGYAITFPIKKGDSVLLVFSSSNLDTWKFSGNKLIAPKNFKPHQLGNAIAIPGLRTLVAAESAEATFVSETALVAHAEQVCLGAYTTDVEETVMRKQDATRFMNALNTAITTTTVSTKIVPITQSETAVRASFGVFAL